MFCVNLFFFHNFLVIYVFLCTDTLIVSIYLIIAEIAKRL